MTKFTELRPEQKDAVKSLLMVGLDRQIKDHIAHTEQTYKLLILGNGAGIALLASFMGVIVGRGNPVQELVAPLSIFLLGTVLGGIIHARLAAFMQSSVNHYATETFRFVLDQLDWEQFRSWQPTKVGKVVATSLPLASFVCFIVAVAWCVRILARVNVPPA